MNQKISVLVIEDEKSICDFISRTLEMNGYKVMTAFTGKDGLQAITSALPDLVLLDLGLPDMDGNDVIRETRKWSGMPIIVISARIQEKEKVEALDAGADDYITKPFGTSELLARIRTAMRHSNKMSAADTMMNRPYHAKDLTVDFDKRLITLEGQEIHLTRVEYKIVSFLAGNSGKVITYDALINQIWGPYAGDNNRILRVNMANIRRKLEKNPGGIKFLNPIDVTEMVVWLAESEAATKFTGREIRLPFADKRFGTGKDDLDGTLRRQADGLDFVSAEVILDLHVILAQVRDDGGRIAAGEDAADAEGGGNFIAHHLDQGLLRFPGTAEVVGKGSRE